MKVERTTQIAAPPEDVYRLVMDPHRLDEWVSIHDSLPNAPDGELVEGSELTQRLRLARRRFTVRWKVTAGDPPERVVWEGRGPLRTHARATYEIAAHDGGSRFYYANEFTLPGGPAGRLAGRGVRRTAEREMDRSLDRLKRLVEREAGQESGS
jgi:carbon monoxide dehydrogenase subunit G